MNYRVLVLGFSDDDRRVLSIILKLEGYEVIASSEPMCCPVYSRCGGVCPYGAACTDFIFIDLQRANISTFDLLEAQSRGHCSVSLDRKAVFTNSLTEEEVKRAEKLGCKIFKIPYRYKEITNWLSKKQKAIAPERKLFDLAS